MIKKESQEKEGWRKNEGKTLQIASGSNKSLMDLCILF